MGRRFKTRRIKANKAYRIDELADAADVVPATIRQWLKGGMDRLDCNRPTIIMGFQVLAFLEARKASVSRPLGLGEFYCLRCKTPRSALGAMADYVATSTTGGHSSTRCTRPDITFPRLYWCLMRQRLHSNIQQRPSPNKTQ